MCFTDDCDWYASIVEDEIIPAKTIDDDPNLEIMKESLENKCDECSRVIRYGEWIRHIYMQEHEECQNAEEINCEGDLECPEECDHDYGETFDCYRCETCDQLIEAIHQHELAEGCRESESRPNLDGLHDALWEGDGKTYLTRAETLYPGITERLTESFRYAINRKD